MAWPCARPLAFLGPNRPPRFRRQYRASSLPARAVNVSRHAGPDPATPQHGVMDTAGTVTRTRDGWPGSHRGLAGSSLMADPSALGHRCRLLGVTPSRAAPATAFNLLP